ncbi:MAG TPA: sugar ABC transporter permease [Symbiobacteriaceae bacterium]|nr:sugar ABC transporter permease [Symbiobacteriaceae bacterium]
MIETKAATAPERGRPHRVREERLALLFLAPALLVMFAVNVYPVLYALWISLHRSDLRRPLNNPFVGLGNFRDVFAESYFGVSLLHTVQFTVLAVALATLLGLAAALILNEKFRLQPVAFAMLLIPWAVPSVVNGLMWKWIYDSQFGSLNGLLYTLGLIDTYQPMLGDPAKAMYLVINAFVWKEVPLAGLLFLTTLKSIPHEMYEAAMVDGADALRRFRYITLPSLKPAFLLVLIYNTMQAIRAFDIIYVLTEGGPGDATSNLAWMAYQESFRHLNLGRGSAMAYLIAMGTFVIAYWYLKALGREATDHA